MTEAVIHNPFIFNMFKIFKVWIEGSIPFTRSNNHGPSVSFAVFSAVLVPNLKL